MNYLMLVCSEDAPIPADADVDAAMAIEDWIALCGPSRIYGEALKEPAAARTVRVRDGRPLVHDGPFNETKEFIAGFDLLDCEDLDAAIRIAAAHPMAAHRMCDLRPCQPEPPADPIDLLVATETGPGRRYMLMVCIDGIPESAEVEAQLQADGATWVQQVRATHACWFSQHLAPQSAATTVRHRSGTTLLSDGPYVESKEFLAGFGVVRCADIGEAVNLAVSNPIAAFHHVEVREMWQPSDWAEMN